MMIRRRVPNVESNTNATKFLMTGVSRNSDEPVNGSGVSRDSDEPVNESSDPTSAMNALELTAHTVRVLHENGKLTEKLQAEFFNGLECCALNTAEFISDEVPNAVTPEAQETQRADGLSRECHLDVDSNAAVHSFRLIIQVT